MRRMGALRVAMPVTAGTFIVGWLAIAGVPPFAGFWSKDEILLYVHAKSPILWAVGLVTALLTAYYMTRQVILVFFGAPRWTSHADAHGAHGDAAPHESPASMLAPLVVLAGLSIVGGAIQLPFSKELHFLEDWLEPVVEAGEASISGSWAYANKWLLLGIAVVVAAAGIAAAVAVYGARRVRAVEPRILEDAWRYDAAAARVVGGPGAAAFRAVAWFDATVVDGVVNGVAYLVRDAGGAIRRLQTGFVRTYALVVGAGAVCVLAWFLARGAV
jgi:NADH-quinone oxidoreductase subunit L